MSKRRFVWMALLVLALVVSYAVRMRQVAEARAQAFEIAIQKAEDLGFNVDKMVISKEIPKSNYLIVAFKSKSENKLNDLEIWLQCNNIYEIKLLGVFNDVDPEKDRDKITLNLLKGSIEDLKSMIKESSP